MIVRPSLKFDVQLEAPLSKATFETTSGIVLRSVWHAAVGSEGVNSRTGAKVPEVDCPVRGRRLTIATNIAESAKSLPNNT